MACCRLLQSAGIITLAGVLECYPSRLITSRPGRLPETADEDPVVLVAARCVKGPFLRQTANGAFLSAVLEVVHPSEAGLDAPWLPMDAYMDRRCKLEVGSVGKGLSLGGLASVPHGGCPALALCRCLIFGPNKFLSMCSVIGSAS